MISGQLLTSVKVEQANVTKLMIYVSHPLSSSYIEELPGGAETATPHHLVRISAYFSSDLISFETRVPENWYFLASVPQNPQHVDTQLNCPRLYQYIRLCQVDDIG